MTETVISTAVPPVAPAPASEAPKPNPMIIAPAQVPPKPEALVTTPAPAVVPDAIPVPVAQPAPASKVASLQDLGVNPVDTNIGVVVTYVDTVAQKNALDLQRAVGHSLEQNNSTFVDEAYIRDTIKDKAEADNVIRMLKGVIDHQSTAAAKVVQDAYAKAGGEANWKAAVAYFNKSATAGEKEAMKTLIASGNQASIDHAVQQVLDAANKGGVTTKHVAPPLGGNTYERGLTRAEYTKIINNPRITDTEYQNARKLRLLGAQNGIN